MTSPAAAEAGASSQTLPTQERNFARQGTSLSPITRQSELFKSLLKRMPDVPFIGRGHPYCADAPGIPYFLALDSEERVVAKGEATNLAEHRTVDPDDLYLADLDGVIAVELAAGGDFILYKKVS